MDLASVIPTGVKRRIPDTWKRRIKTWKRRIKTSPLYREVYLEDRADVENVYHCCTHKSASQWVRSLLADPLTFRYSGLHDFHYQSEWMGGHDPRPFNERYFSKSFPEQTVCSPLYIPYDCFQQIPKPSRYRGFFVLRDPRDVIVSWYFSMKHSHTLMGNIAKLREELQNRPKTEGLCWYIENLTDSGFYDMQRSWIEPDDPSAAVFRYEDLTGPDQFECVRKLFRHCTISLPNSKLRALLDKHSFEKKSGGREKGESDEKHHYRKGKSGDWTGHFTREVAETFLREAGSLASDVGYSSTEDHLQKLAK